MKTKTTPKKKNAISEKKLHKNIFATEQDKLAWMGPYAIPNGIPVIYEEQDAMYYPAVVFEEGTLEAPLPMSKPKITLSDSNGLAPGWRFDIPVLEKA